MTPAIHEIVKAVASEFGVPPERLRGHSRRRIYAHPRQVAMYLACCDGERSTTEVAARFRRDHTTVIHACRAVRRRMEGDHCFRSQVTELESRLRRPRSPLLPVWGYDMPVTVVAAFPVIGTRWG